MNGPLTQHPEREVNLKNYDFFVVNVLEDKKHHCIYVNERFNSYSKMVLSALKVFLRQKEAVKRLWIAQVKLCGRGELCSSCRDSDTSKPRRRITPHTTENATKKNFRPTVHLELVFPFCNNFSVLVLQYFCIIALNIKI